MVSRESSHRITSVLLITVWATIIIYSLLHHYLDESDFYRFSNIYVAFIEMLSRGYVSYDLFNPSYFFFDSNSDVDCLMLSPGAKIVTLTGLSFVDLAMIYTIIINITGLDPSALMLFPIAIFILPIIIIVTSNEYCKEHGFLFSIFLMTYLCQNKIFMSSYIAAFTFPILYMAIFCLKKIFNSHNPKNFALIVGIFVISLTLYWHTLSTMLLIYIVSMALILLFSTYLLGKIKITNFNIAEFNITEKSSFFLTAALCTLLYIVFSDLWNCKYVYISDLAATNPFGTIIGNLLMKVMGQANYYIPYKYNYAETFGGSIYLYTHLAIHLISGLLIAYAITIAIQYIFFQKNHSQEIKWNVGLYPLIAGVAVILSQIIFSVLYSVTGLGLLYVTLLFPLIANYIILSYGNKFQYKIVCISFIVLIILNVILTASAFATLELGQNSEVKSKDTGTSFKWIYKYISPESTIYADFNLFGKYLSEEIKVSKPKYNFTRISGYLDYAYLLGDHNFSSEKDAYASVDHASMEKGLPIHVYGARAQLESHLEKINANMQLSKVYEDEKISVYKFHERN